MAKALRPIIRDLLCCPTCNGELTDLDQALTCAACDQVFPVVEGVPVMIAGADPEQFIVGEFERFGPVSEHDYAPKSRELIERHRDGLVLDLGAGGKDAHFEHVVQVDIFRFPRTDVVCQAESLPFKPGRFSAVVSQAVFEHLRYPEMAAAEIFRVCKPGAEIKIDTAFLQAVHGYPDHYYNATLSGLKHWFHMFYIDWEGVEPYQRPYIALAQLTDFLLENLSGACRAVAGSVSLRELLDVIGTHATGRPLDEQGRRLIECLNQVNPDFEDRIAAGVSI